MNHLDKINETKAAVQRNYQEAVRRDFRHNATSFCGVELIWSLGIPFAMYATVVPSYLSFLGATKTVIGVVVAMFTILCPLQILVSHLGRTRPRKAFLVLFFMTCPLPWLAYNIVFLAVPGLTSMSVQITIFCMCMVFYAALVGGTGPLYQSLIIDCTPVKKRGSFFGYRLTVLAVGMLITAPFSVWVMKHWPEGQNYLIAFAIANVFYMLSSVSFWPVREHRDPTVNTRRSGLSRTNRLVSKIRLMVRKMTKDPNYRIFLFFNILFFVSVMLGSFIVVFAKETLGLKGSGIIVFSLMQFGGGAIFSLILGRVADRIGYRTIGVIQGLALAGAFVLLLLSSPTWPMYVFVVYAAFLIYAGMAFVGNMVMVNMSVEFLPKQNRGMLLALNNTFLMPAVLVAAPLAGAIIDKTASYTIIFAIGALLAIISAFGFAILVREPRKRKMYVIRYMRRL